jgi:hypothetical protein
MQVLIELVSRKEPEGVVFAETQILNPNEIKYGSMPSCQNKVKTNSDSKDVANGDSMKATNLNLALSQANEALSESMATRRAVDTKIYSLIILSATVLGLLLTLHPWSSKGPTSLFFFVSSFVAYAVTILLGIIDYSPVGSSTFDARAILESMTQSYDNLAKWTTEILCDCTDANYEISRVKSCTVRNMLLIFLLATSLLALATILN